MYKCDSIKMNEIEKNPNCFKQLRIICYTITAAARHQPKNRKIKKKQLQFVTEQTQDLNVFTKN